MTARGTSGANFLAFAALIEPGDEVLVERPTYEPLLAALGFLGARVRRFERRFENGYRLDLDEIRSLLTDQVRLVVLANPHNPSGVLLPPDEVAGLARIAAQAGAHLLVDEVYRDIWFDEAPPSHVHLGPNVLATSSLTKSYGLSGLRCGWILCAPGSSRAGCGSPWTDAGRGLGAERHTGRSPPSGSSPGWPRGAARSSTPTSRRSAPSSPSTGVARLRRPRRAR